MFELDHQAEKKHAPVLDVSELLKKPYLTENEAAAITGRSIHTLRNERYLKKGFPYVKYSRSVRYKTSDIIATMEARRISFEG